MASSFEHEVATLMEVVEYEISQVLLSKDRTSKHDPWTWLEEEEDEHLRKASRHILTHQLIRDCQQKSDGENHLRNALCRLAMSVAKRQIRKKPYTEEEEETKLLPKEQAPLPPPPPPVRIIKEDEKTSSRKLSSE